MKLGIVGTGMIVREVLPVLQSLAGITIEALCGTPRSADMVNQLCEQYSIANGVTDYEAMLKMDIDTVYVAVPNHLHASFCMQALAASKHVIVEKPMTAALADTTALIKMAKEQQLFLYEAISTRYLENYIRLKELLPRIGEIKLVQCSFCQYSSRYDAFLAGEIAPAFNPEMAGGALMDINHYNLHYVVGLFGKPEHEQYFPNVERGVDTSGVAILKYPTFTAVCLGAKDCGTPARYLIQGTKGYLLQETTANICGAITIHFNDGTKEHYDENRNRHRMCAEFEAFERQMRIGDLASCYEMLNSSLVVSEIETNLRSF